MGTQACGRQTVEPRWSFAVTGTTVVTLLTVNALEFLPALLIHGLCKRRLDE